MDMVLHRTENCTRGLHEGLVVDFIWCRNAGGLDLMEGFGGNKEPNVLPVMKLKWKTICCKEQSAQLNVAEKISRSSPKT